MSLPNERNENDLLSIEDRKIDNGDKFNFYYLSNKLRALIESICDLFLYMQRLQNNNYDHSKQNIVPVRDAMNLSSRDLSAYSEIFQFEINGGYPVADSDVYKFFARTCYNKCVENILTQMQNISKTERLVNTELLLDKINFRTKPSSVLSVISKNVSSKISRYSIIVSMHYCDSNGSFRNIYNEYVEEFGWKVVPANPNLKYPGVSQNSVTLSAGDSFVSPIRDIFMLYDRANEVFDSVSVSSSELNINRLKTLNTKDGCSFFALVKIGQASNNEIKDVLVPKKLLDYNEAILKSNIKWDLKRVYNPNGLDCFLSTRKIRIGGGYLYKLMLSLYTNKFYDFFIKNTIPSKFTVEVWRVTQQQSRIDYSSYVCGVDYIIELESLFEAPEDRLEFLGICSRNIIEDARIAYEWFVCQNWTFNYNEHMQFIKDVVVGKTVKFNESLYNMTLSLNSIEALGYFIASCQRYILILYMKFLTKLTNKECNISLAFILSFSNNVISAFSFFSMHKETEQFFKSRDIRISGNNVYISGLFEKVSSMDEEHIYLKWLEISGVNKNQELWDGKVIKYPDIKILKALIKRNLSSKYEESFYVGDILEFIFSDIIRVSSNIVKEFYKVDFPEIIRKINFSTIYDTATDTSNPNHERLCIELCKYYCAFYDNELILEI